MKYKKLYILFIIFSIFSCKNNRITTIELGLFAGSCWDTPNLNTFIMFDEIIDIFNTTYPNIKVTYKSGILKEDYSEWLSQKILTSREPDLFLVLPEDFTTFASIGILEKLDNRIKIDNPEGLYKNIMTAGIQKEQLYGIPFEINPTFMFVNRTLLNKEKVKFPNEDWSWSEFTNLCKKLTRDTNNNGYIDQFGVRNYTWLHAVYSNGEALFNEEGSRTFLNTEGVKEACELLASLSLLDEIGLATDFESGTIAFEPFTYSTFRTYGYYPYSIIRFGDFDWVTTLMPRGPRGKNAVDIKSLLLSISSRSHKKVAAEKFLNFIINNKSAQIAILRNSKGLPPRKDILSSTEAKKILTRDLSSPHRAISEKTITETIENSIIVPRFKGDKHTLSIIDKEISRLPINSTIIENNLSRLNRLINDKLKE